MGALVFAGVLCSAAWAQQAATVEGQVADPSGAVIPRASIVVEAQPSGSMRRATTNGEGRYRVRGLKPGRYRVTARAKGFRSAAVTVSVARAGQTVVHDFHLSIATQSQKVVVTANAPQLHLSPQANASAVVVSGKNLNALSNDPDELQNQLEALAGPSVGPNGGEIYIDGFTGGDMPPKSAIRSIRVNSDPFSVVNDRLGYGRIDISTKPGAARYHGSASGEYNDSHMNALSKFLAGSTQPPPSYHTWLTDGNLGGPIGKNASFYFAFQRRNIDRASLVNTDVLDSNLKIVPYIATVPNPRIRTNVDPRVDVQLGQKNTLSATVQYFQIDQKNNGVDTQALPSTAYDSVFHHLDVRVMDNEIVNANLVNEPHFQLLHFDNFQRPKSFAPTLDVLGAFTGGGDSGGTYKRYETHYEFQDYATLTHGKHLIRFGGFIRDIVRDENTDAGFNGTFTFNSLADYQKTEQALAAGESMAQIQAAGFGPSQFNITGGKRGVGIYRLDGALFVGDEWKASNRFTLDYGLRFESQNGISDHADWAPRVGLAWGLGDGSHRRTIVRAGWGVFYERYDDDQMIMTARMNGTNQISYIVYQPQFFPAPPPLSTITASLQPLPVTYRVAPHLRSPYTMDFAASVEQQLTPDATASLTYVYTRGQRQLLTNDVNAPLPGSFDPNNPTSGTRPLGNATGNIYEYEAAGIFRQTQLIANIHVNAGNRLSLFGYYVFNDAHGDSNGVNSFASNPYNLMEDYGRTAFDIRNRATLGGTTTLPLALRLSALFIGGSGEPFSILLPQDLYGTGIHNARPSLATASTPAADVAVTRYGRFNTAPSPTATPIPPNTETGPANFMLNLRASRTFGIGPAIGKAHGGEGTASAASGGRRRRHSGGLGGRGLAGGGGFGLGGATTRRYALTLSVSALNALNHVNLAPPVSTLGSPLFGQSISLAGGPYSAQVGNPVANRLLNVSVAFSF